MRRAAFPLAAIAVALAHPAHAAPCAGFTDVQDTSPFCASVAWMKNRGVTLGCGDGTTYCPDQFVTRLQMAAFMYRLGFQNAFLQGGNAFGAPAALGSTDAQPLWLVANGQRMLEARDATATTYGRTPNLVLGSASNAARRNCSRSLADAILCQSSEDVVGAAVGGGGGDGALGNFVTDSLGTVAGGAANIAGSDDGDGADAPYASVGGGYGNRAGANASVVAGGTLNTASGYASAIPGGVSNVASGAYSFAAGVRAQALHDRSFVWGGSNTADTASAGPGDFVVYAPGRVRLFAGTTGSGGCEVGSADVGGNLTCTGVITAASFVPPSDRAVKTDFVPVDPQAVLARVVALPVATWSYKASPEVRHIGPTAQDFRALFGVGDTDAGIATIDADGVALAAVQGLAARLEARLAEAHREIADLRREVAALRAAQVGILERARAAIAATPGDEAPAARLAARE